MLYKEFYSEIGKLLYAVADIDKMISGKEKKILQEIVKKELAPVEKHTDEFGTDAAFYSEIEFEFNEEQIIDTESAFNSFIEFVEDHHSAIDEKMKKVCLHIVKEIASAYHGTNKKEKRLINVLKHKLDELVPRKSRNPIKVNGVDPLFSSEPRFDYLNERDSEPQTVDQNVEIIEDRNHVFEKGINKRAEQLGKKVSGRQSSKSK